MQTYSVTFNLQLIPDEVELLYAANTRGNVDLCRDRETRVQVLNLLGGANSRKAVIEKMKPVKMNHRIEKRKQTRLAYSETHRTKERHRHRSVVDVLRRPNYSYERYHRGGVDPNGLHQWNNRKPRKMYHFRSDLWPVRGPGDASPLTRSTEWTERNEERARVERFKAELDARYPKLFDHTQCFLQKSHYPSDPIDFSRLVLLSRPYDEDNKRLYPEGRRFSDKLLGQLSHDCQSHGLRVVVEDRLYRKRQARFILIADANVDLVQAYQFAVSLPVL